MFELDIAVFIVVYKLEYCIVKFHWYEKCWCHNCNCWKCKEIWV